MNEKATPNSSDAGLMTWDRGGLSFRIVMVLSLVLLPLALVAGWQTQRATQAGLSDYRSRLLDQTAAAAAPERDAILGAFATAATLSETIALQLPSRDDCVTLMRAIAEANPRFTFVGFVGPEQRSTCNQSDRAFDFSGDEATERLFADPRPEVTFEPSGAVSQVAVLIVSHPVLLDDGSFGGFIAISFPAMPLVLPRPDEPRESDLPILTFNNMGDILTSDLSEAELGKLMPASGDLQSLSGTGRRVFSASTATGEQRDFAVVPIVESRVYALSSAPSTVSSAARGMLVDSALLLPVLMWLVTLVVAVLVLHRQVIVPTRRLAMRMRSFADGRAILSGNTMEAAPSEMREIGETFASMAEGILRDEAELENRLHEREILLREVHHRVKNNLQLMSSIINMQIRQSASPQEEEALRRVQGRLASLAQFHRDLYQSPSLVGLRADQLLEDLTRQLVSVSRDPARPFDLRLELEPVAMSPDQVSPLAMLVTEAMTNAIKYTATDDESRPFVRLSLRVYSEHEPGVVSVRVVNSVSGEEEGTKSEGLGTRLIGAFAVQLNAEVQQERKDGIFAVRVTFALEPFRNEEGTGEAPRPLTG